jgi:hypothetical protein
LRARIRFGIRFGFGVKHLHDFFNSDSNSCGQGFSQLVLLHKYINLRNKYLLSIKKIIQRF